LQKYTGVASRSKNLKILEGLNLYLAKFISTKSFFPCNNISKYREAFNINYNTWRILTLVVLFVHIDIKIRN